MTAHPASASLRVAFGHLRERNRGHAGDAPPAWILRMALAVACVSVSAVLLDGGRVFCSARTRRRFGAVCFVLWGSLIQFARFAPAPAGQPCHTLRAIGWVWERTSACVCVCLFLCFVYCACFACIGVRVVHGSGQGGAKSVFFQFIIQI